MYSFARSSVRADGSTVIGWVNEVKDIQIEVNNLGNEWKTIPPAEATYTATRWFTDVEQKLVESI